MIIWIEAYKIKRMWRRAAKQGRLDELREHLGLPSKEELKAEGSFVWETGERKVSND